MTRPAALVVLLLGTSAAAAQPAGEVFSPRDGGFSVRFPGRPKDSTQTAKSRLGDLRVFTATYATGEGNVYLVSHTDFPPGATKPENRATLFDGVRDGLKGKDGKVLSEKDAEIGPNKLAGRDIELEKGKQRVRFRVVVSGDRLYQVAAIGTPAFVGGKEAGAFLDSFELTK